MVLSEPVLVGRQKELDEIINYFDSVQKGKGKTVLISGKAGSGKTRLVNEFLKIAKKKEVIILSGWCLNNASLPYFPFIEAFTSNTLFSEDARFFFKAKISDKSWLTNPLQPEKLNTNRATIPQIWQDQTFLTVSEQLLLRSSVKPLILVLEDMHWADSASLALLHYISRVTLSEKILILVTFRDEELGFNENYYPHQLTTTIQLMGREELYRQIKLKKLKQDEVKKIAESMLGSSLETELILRLFRESNGNPLFVVEFLRMLAEQGSLAKERNIYKLSIKHIGIPTKIKEIIIRRINALNPKQRRVLDIASVVGDIIDPDLIGAVIEKDGLEVLELLNKISHSTSLLKVEEGVYKFDHSKSREILYDELALPLKKRYHARIAEKLELTNRIGGSLFNDLAHHYTNADNNEKSIKYSLLAGNDALDRFSNKEAIKHFQNVLQTINSSEDHIVEKEIALEGLGDAYYSNCMFENAIDIFEKLANSRKKEVKLRAYRKEMDAVWYKEQDSTSLMKLVKKAEKYSKYDRLESGRILFYKARAFARSGDPVTALKNNEKALQIFEEEYSLYDMEIPLAVTGFSRLLAGGNISKALSEVQRAVKLCQELGDIRSELIVTLIRNLVFDLYGINSNIFGSYDRILEIGKKIGDFESLAQAASRIALKFENEKRLEEAINLSLKALDFHKKTDSWMTRSFIYSSLSRQYAKIGNLERAEHFFSLLMEMPRENIFHARNRIFVLITEAVLFAAKQQWRKSDQSFQKIFEILKTNPFNYVGYKLSCKINYEWTLSKQGRYDEAKVQRMEIKEIYSKFVTKFMNSNLLANLIIPREVTIGKEFEFRLDIVNVSFKPTSVNKVEGLIPNQGFTISSLPSFCILKEKDLILDNSEIGVFEVQTIKFNLNTNTEGLFNFSPIIKYIDESGELKKSKINPININVKPRIPDNEDEKKITEKSTVKPEFESEAAKRAFDFLINAFVQDYSIAHLSEEKSGWRTLMDVIKGANVSQYSFYGSNKNRGYALSELLNLGVVEGRFFIGERGRGGKILKLRVQHKKEYIRLLLYK